MKIAIIMLCCISGFIVADMIVLQNCYMSCRGVDVLRGLSGPCELNCSAITPDIFHPYRMLNRTIAEMKLPEQIRVEQNDVIYAAPTFQHPHYPNNA